jgi:uncharacterized protein YjiK
MKALKIQLYLICLLFISTLSVTGAVAPVGFLDATEDASGWWHQAGYGWFWELGGGWIWHVEHGYQWIHPSGAYAGGGIYVWDYELGCWMWVNSSVYPWFYAWGLNTGWLKYTLGGAPWNREFRALKSSRIRSGLSVYSYSAQQAGNEAVNLYDDDFSTSTGARWSAEGFPHNVVLDLGATYSCDQVVLYPMGDRPYQYTVAFSASPTSGFSTKVNRSSNTTAAASLSDPFSATSARYVKLEVTGLSNNSSTWASIIELQVYAQSLVPIVTASSHLDLSRYQKTNTYSLPSATAAETSAVTWNWDTDTLFVVGDEGLGIVQVSKTGAQIDKMSLSGFADTEGLAYIGNGQFVITEERLQDAYLVTYVAGSTVSRSALPALSIGSTVDNIGIEGISYDRLTGKYVAVKEKSPEVVHDIAMDFYAKTIAVKELFAASKLSLTDLSDVQTLGSVVALDDAGKQNLLIVSQESSMLLEVSPTGTILSSMDLSGISTDIEGVTIDADGTIYLTDQAPTLYMLKAQ